MEKRSFIAAALSLLILIQEMSSTPISAQIEVVPGPASGVIIKDAPGLLLTERKLINQKIFMQFDPHRAIAERIKLPSASESPVFVRWYAQHINRSKESVKEILRQLDNTFVTRSQFPSNRPKRFLGQIMAGVVMAIVGAVVGTSMSIANTVSVSILNEHTESIQRSLKDSRARLDVQQSLLDDAIQLINEIVVIQNSHSEAINRLIDSQEQVIKIQTMHYMLVDPINYLTQDYLRQVQANIDTLIKGQIPLYFVTSEDVREILSQLHHVVIDDMQLRVALEMGTALPLFIDVDKLQISYLLSLPLVLPEKIYQTKQVFNVGVWKGETYMKVKTPAILAYQPWRDGDYFVPNLETCAVFKDHHFLCPGQPFVPEFSTIGCGVTNIEDSLSTCEVIVSQPGQHTLNTVVERLDRRWLVSTNLENMTVTYASHGTYKVGPLEHKISLITVPKDVIVTIGSQALFHVSGAELTENIQLISMFNSDGVEIDKDLEWLLQHKQNHSLRFAVKRQNITVDRYLYDKKDLNMISEKDRLVFKVTGLTLAVGVITMWLAAISAAVYRGYRSKKVIKLNDGKASRGVISFAKFRIVADDPEKVEEVQESEDEIDSP